VDEALRKLARRAARGEPDAEVGLLLGRVRLGEVSPAGVGLAAYLGDRLARRAAPDAPAPPDGEALEAFLGGLEAFGKATLVRAAVAMARAGLAAVAAARPDDRGVRPALAAAAAWATAPTEARRVAARLAGDAAYAAGEELGIYCLEPELEGASWAAFAAAHAARAAGELRDEAVLEHVVEAGRCALDEEASDGEARLAATVRGELLRWSLADAPDPLAGLAAEAPA